MSNGGEAREGTLSGAMHLIHINDEQRRCGQILIDDD
jgi:hypothetical protein